MKPTIVNLPKLAILATLCLVVPILLAILALAVGLLLYVSPDLGQTFGVFIVLFCVGILTTGITLITIGG